MNSSFSSEGFKAAQRCLAESVTTLSAEITLNLAFPCLANSVFPDSLAVTAGAAGQSDYTEVNHCYCVQLLSFSEKS